MQVINYLFGPGMFFAPLIYVFIYLCVERGCSRQLPAQHLLKAVTVLAGLALIVYAFAAAPDFMVLLPSRGTAKHGVPAAYFLVIFGATLMTLPLYSKHITFTNSNR